jgi:hypothetical protein
MMINSEYVRADEILVELKNLETEQFRLNDRMQIVHSDTKCMVSLLEKARENRQLMEELNRELMVLMNKD